MRDFQVIQSYIDYDVDISHAFCLSTVPVGCLHTNNNNNSSVPTAIELQAKRSLTALNVRTKLRIAFMVKCTCEHDPCNAIQMIQLYYNKLLRTYMNDRAKARTVDAVLLLLVFVSLRPITKLRLTIMNTFKARIRKSGESFAPHSVAGRPASTQKSEHNSAIYCTDNPSCT